jgi:antirestriction protein
MPLYTSYSEETQTLIEEFLENTFGWDEDELVEFVEKHGETYFLTYFEEYADMVDKVGREVVEAFLEEFDISDVSSLEDYYQGQYNSGAEFAQMIAEDCGDIGRNMAGWIEIDWEASWNNLSYDYVECGDGYIFSNH